MTVTVPPPLHGYCDHQENRESVIGCDHLKCTQRGHGITVLSLPASGLRPLEVYPEGTTVSQRAEDDEWPEYQPLG
jgi:hypothetical protein